SGRGEPSGSAMCAFRALFALDSCFRRNGEEKMRTGIRFNQSILVHLEADLRQTIAWATEHGQRWAFTLSNAGSYRFQDRCDLAQLGEINWNAVQTYDGWGETPDIKEGKQAEFLEDAAAFLAKHSATHKHFDRVVELVAGFESPRGLELLSKVHWIACKQRAKTMDAIAERVYAWNEGKKRVPQWQIGIAAEALSNKGWMNVPGGMDRWLSQYPR
ncbi:MAG: DarT ssDNA thymidine ADP-ribosyltransferase family protein, partial [Gammaproteobacteria bacterium]|nr:DarT ssDNA thymidine ADP-ribosyltransferase family protein [Gammaproteobacteria bacterium]